MSRHIALKNFRTVFYFSLIALVAHPEAERLGNIPLCSEAVYETMNINLIKMASVLIITTSTIAVWNFSLY
jgi:hypothetical protein